MFASFSQIIRYLGPVIPDNLSLAPQLERSIKSTKAAFYYIGRVGEDDGVSLGDVSSVVCLLERCRPELMPCPQDDAQRAVGAGAHVGAGDWQEACHPSGQAPDAAFLGFCSRGYC